MACSGKLLLCLGFFVIATSLCHCMTLTRLKAIDKLRKNSTLSQGRATGSGLRHGKLIVGQNFLQEAKDKGTKVKNLLDVDTDYQADMGWPEPKQPKETSQGFTKPRSDDAAVERLLKMEPKIECTGDSMTLQVQDAASTPGSLFFVDRGSRLSPLPLSKLPPSCGYNIRSTRRDLVLVAPYDGCFVALEEDSYVLPLRWCGVPVRMSCPFRPSSPNPPMVTCHAEGMVVKTEWTVSVAKIKVHLKGNWEPLMKASSRCRFSVVVHPEGVVISVHYAPCLEEKDAMYTLQLAGEGETTISCPAPSVAQHVTESSAKDPTQQLETPSKGLHPFVPSPNSSPTHAREQTWRPQPAVPQLPGFPQNPDVHNKKPNQGSTDVAQPQLPYYPFYYPPLIYPHTDTKPTPTVQPPPSPVTNNIQRYHQTAPPSKLPVAPEVPQPFNPLPFYPWQVPLERPVVKEPPIQASVAKLPMGKDGNPFYPYPYYIKPSKPDIPSAKPVPTSPPVIQTTKGPRQQPYYPFPFYPQPKPQVPLTWPLVTKAPAGEVDERIPPNSFNPAPGPPQTSSPVGPSVKQPEDQEQKPLFPFPLYPQPPASVEHEAQPLHPMYPETPERMVPEKTVPPKPPVSQTQGKLPQPFYPYPYYPLGPYQVHVPPTKQTPKQPPKGQDQQPQNPLQPEAPKPNIPGYLYPSKPAPENKKPSQPESPQGQVHQYPYPQPAPSENQPAEKPTTVQQPQQPEAPWGQMHQFFYAYPYYPQPNPENQPSKKPVYKPSHPQPSKTPSAGTYDAKIPAELPKPAEQPPGVKLPHGQVHHPFKPYYPQQPQYPQPVTLPPPTSTQQLQQFTITQPSNGGKVPQAPSSLYCPQSCPSGLSNCCVQIAFHQHVHHIVPAGLGGKDTPPYYPALPFLPSMVYSGSGNSLDTEARTEVSTVSNSAPSSPQSLPQGNEKQPYLLPPDGNPTVLTSIPRHPTQIESPTNSYFGSNSQYPNWPFVQQMEELHNIPQSQSAVHDNIPSKSQTAGYGPVNRVGQYEPYYIQPPGHQMSQPSPVDLNNRFWSNLMPYIGQYQRETIANQQNEARSKEQQLPSKTPSDAEKLTHPQSEHSRFLVPYHMLLQDAEAPSFNSSSQTQPFVSGSDKSTKHEWAMDAYSEPKSYLLLQHGPPRREPNTSSESPPFRDLVHEKFMAQNIAKHHGSEFSNPQALKPQHHKWLGKMSSLPQPGDNLESESLPSPVTTLDGSHFVPLPQDLSFSVAHLKPEFSESLKDMWRPIRPLGSNRRHTAHISGKTI